MSGACYLQVFVFAGNWFGVPVKEYVKLWRSGGVGEVLAEGVELAVTTGPRGAGRS